MMSLTFGLFTQVSGSGPLGPLVLLTCRYRGNPVGSLPGKCLAVYMADHTPDLQVSLL